MRLCINIADIPVVYIYILLHATHMYDLNELLLHALFVWLARSAGRPKSSSDGLDPELKWIRSGRS